MKLPIKRILQIEYQEDILTTRAEILTKAGYSVTSVLGTNASWRFEKLPESLDLVVIGHGAAWNQRRDLIVYFRASQPSIPVIALLRSTDVPFHDASFNCRADEPIEWLKTIEQVLENPSQG